MATNKREPSSSVKKNDPREYKRFLEGQRAKKADNPERSKRDTALALGADETGSEFRKALKRIASQKKP